MNVIVAPGCFDGPCHAGHASLLRRAKALGDYLIVLLPTDEIVRQLKGEERPVATWEQRAAALRRLGCVDAVLKQTTLTPREWLEELAPACMVKGVGSGETEGSQYADSVVYLPLLHDVSTTRLIEEGCHAHGGSERVA